MGSGGRNCIDPGYVNGEGGGMGIKKSNGGEIKKFRIIQKSQSLEMIK